MTLTQNIPEEIELYYRNQPDDTKHFIDQSVDQIVEVKQNGGKIIVVTGSGPNLHEGVTTLIAELMNKGLIDGVSTSSAVIAHELAGTLDRVKRLNGIELGIPRQILPMGNIFEFTLLSSEMRERLENEMVLDNKLLGKGEKLPGNVIIKAAGNMAYPMGLRTERLAREILAMAKAHGLPFEAVAGWGADAMTMIGAGFRNRLPVLVSVPQLVGGGGVGLAIGDSISITERSMRMAQMITSADVIIESAIALTQEIHDGPFETYTGHGIWANWDGYPTASLENKTLIRIDLDPNLKRAWEMQRESAAIQGAIDKGLPKTKLTGIPFRMEMSGFARLESSLPLVGDIGSIWPVLAWHVSERLGVHLDFISHPQQTPQGQQIRDWIVDTIAPFDREKMFEFSRDFRSNS